MKKKWFLRNDYNEKDLIMNDYSLLLDLSSDTTWYFVLHEKIEKGLASYTFSANILEHSWFQKELIAKNLSEAKKEVEMILKKKCANLIIMHNSMIKEWSTIIDNLNSEELGD